MNFFPSHSNITFAHQKSDTCTLGQTCCGGLRSNDKSTVGNHEMIKGGCQVGIQSTIGPVLSDGNIKQYIGINVIDSNQCLKLIAGK